MLGTRRCFPLSNDGIWYFLSRAWHSVYTSGFVDECLGFTRFMVSENMGCRRFSHPGASHSCIDEFSNDGISNFALVSDAHLWGRKYQSNQVPGSRRCFLPSVDGI